MYTGVWNCPYHAVAPLEPSKDTFVFAFSCIFTWYFSLLASESYVISVFSDRPGGYLLLFVVFYQVSIVSRLYFPAEGLVHRNCLLVGCLTSQQQASVCQGRICSDNCTCCHTEIELADQTFYLTHSILTPGQPVPVLTLERQAPGRVATGVLMFKSLV